MNPDGGPRTVAGRTLLDWMEYIRDPEHYQPGNVGRGPFWDDDLPLVLKVEAEAEATASAIERVEALPNYHEHFVYKADVLAILRGDTDV